MGIFKRVVAAAMLCGIATAAAAQDYPARPVKIFVGAAAGGSTDLVARVVAKQLTKMWNVSVLIENRTGASGAIAAEAVAKSDPDGYTIFGGSFAPSVIAASRDKVPYDPFKDFAHAVLVSTYPQTIVVLASSPIQDLKQLIAEAKANPGKLNYGTGGVGSSTHLFIEMMNTMAGLKTTNVPYRGGAPALNALLGGELDFAGLALPIVHAQGTNLRPLAVTSGKPNRFLPGVPSLSEIVPGYDAEDLIVFQVPVATPKPIVDKINRDVNIALQDPEVRASLDLLNQDIRGGSVEDATDYLRRAIERWRPIIKATGLGAM